jgi:hypothetical protein
MAQNNNNVYAAEPGVAGAIFVAPLGTTAPALANDPGGATATLSVTWLDLGNVGDDGFTEKTDRRITRKRNFGGKVIKVLQTEYGITYELIFAESLNADVLKAIYGSTNVDVLPATATHGQQIAVRKNARKLPHQSWVVDTLDTSLGKTGNPGVWRTYIPDGQIVDTRDVKIDHTDTIEYGVTIEAFEKNGNNVITWTDDGQRTGS